MAPLLVFLSSLIENHSSGSCAFSGMQILFEFCLFSYSMYTPYDVLAFWFLDLFLHVVYCLLSCVIHFHNHMCISRLSIAETLQNLNLKKKKNKTSKTSFYNQASFYSDHIHLSPLTVAFIQNLDLIISVSLPFNSPMAVFHPPSDVIIVP